MDKKLSEIIKNHFCNIGIQVRRFNEAHCIESKRVTTIPNQKVYKDVALAEGIWDITTEAISIGNDSGVFDLKVKFELVKGSAINTNAGIDFSFDNWSADNYVLMPAAVYNGNRFTSIKMNYPPMLDQKEDISPFTSTIITDVPRLNIGEGESKIQQLAGDLSTPAVGFFSPEYKYGFWILTPQSSNFGDIGFTVEESRDRNKAVISVNAPGVREDVYYTMGNTSTLSKDRGADFWQGDVLEITARVHFFKCENIQGLFDYFVNIRKSVADVTDKSYQEIPFSAAWKIQEEKFNIENWEEKYGYYSCYTLEDPIHDFDLGWCGGLQVTHPLLMQGSELSKDRVLKNYDFTIPNGQGASGYFHTAGDGERWYSDHFHRRYEERWHLTRRSADALFNMMKQLMLLKTKYQHELVLGKLEEGIEKCAQAFLKTWEKWGQLGQYVDTEIGDIIIGGTTSAGIAPAGLALASIYFNRSEYLSAAKDIADYFYSNYVVKGISNGGPSDICQCPDSESSFGLLESFVTLYEVTGDEVWVKRACEMANQCMTWCVSYQFKFPENSTFGKMKMHSLGSVYANVQNKHGSPGICTLSGVSLFKLYRATGNLQYLELIKDIAHNIPQYLSRKDRPIKAMDGRIMPPGWMCERVQLSDWWEPVGEIFYGSCWCEVSNMMTYAEIPGIYVQTDTGLLMVIDHVKCDIISCNSESLVVNISNPTKFDAEVKVFCEKSTSMARTIGQNALMGKSVLKIKAMESITVCFTNCME